MNRFTSLGLAVVAGAALGALAVNTLKPDPTADATAKPADEPLYWVAPMDPDYRRDGPGKSPMGMDLVPVYAEQAANQSGPGAVRINPAVVNNLGVRTARVQSGTLNSVIRTVGYVRYDEDRLVHIHPRLEGWVDKLHVKATGDPVEQGQPLYTLYSPELVNAQEELLLALGRDNQRLIDAAHDRLRALQVSQDYIDRLRRDGQVHQTVTFYAPAGGVVDNLNIREGFYVKPGTTLMSIGNLDEVWVEAEIFERQAALVSTGQAVTMRLDYLPGRNWDGEVDYVYPTLDPDTRTARVRLRFANAGGELKPNMFAQVLIHADAGSPSLLVPRDAVIRTGNQDRVVMVLDEGQFKSVAVELGGGGDGQVEILGGVQEGDQVVVSAQFLLDSESSRDSDFRRMDSSGSAMPDPMNHTEHMDHSHHGHGHSMGEPQEETPTEDKGSGHDGHHGMHHPGAAS